MTYELSNEDKVSIIDQHLRNLEYSKYNLEISILEENAATTPDPSVIAGNQSKISEIENKITALNNTKAELE